MARSDKYTALSNTIIYYSDFTNNLDRNPITNYLSKYVNENAVKSSIRNLVLTGNGERFYNSLIGSKISTLLFDPIDDVTALTLKNTIRETIDNYEPRANLLEINVTPDDVNNAYYVSVVFGIINIPEVFNLDLILNRVR
jgi:phage baseplate assembly protein W